MGTKIPKHIMITGASSGIGAALAKFYAVPDNVLHLCARNSERLEEVSKSCRSVGAEVYTQVVDVTDMHAMQDWIKAVSRDTGCPELVIANAGISGSSSSSPNDHLQIIPAQVTRNILAVNFAGVLNTVLPVVDLMSKNNGGQIAMVSSLAGYRGLPSAPAYSTSKVAVRAYGEAIRPLLAPHGIKINVIMPGFVESRMTAANRFHMPLLMTAEKAAGIIALGLQKNKARITFPWPMALLTAITGILPPALMDPFLSRLPAKN